MFNARCVTVCTEAHFMCHCIALTLILLLASAEIQIPSGLVKGFSVFMRKERTCDTMYSE